MELNQQKKENLERCFDRVVQLNGDYKEGQNLIGQTFKFVKEKYLNYQTLCQSIGKQGMSVLSLEHVEMFEWNLDSCKEIKSYYEQLVKVPKDIVQAFFSQGEQLADYHIWVGAQLISVLQRACMMQHTALEDYMGMLCGDDMDNLFMLYMDVLKHSSPSTKIVNELMAGINTIIGFCSGLEQAMTQKMHVKVEKRAEKYKQLYENIAGFYQNNTQSIVNVAMGMTDQPKEAAQQPLIKEIPQPAAQPQPKVEMPQPQPKVEMPQQTKTAAQQPEAQQKQAGIETQNSDEVLQQAAALLQQSSVLQQTEAMVQQALAAQLAAQQPEVKAAEPDEEEKQPEVVEKEPEVVEKEPDEMDDTQNMLEKLLEYSQLDEEFCEGFRGDFGQYIKLSDKGSSDQDARKLRKSLSDRFYGLYEAVFFRAEEEMRDNAILRLFLNFGVVDEAGFEEERLQQLQKAVEDTEEELKIPVYTIRGWLRQIYTDQKEPSRNEFDMDFEQYLREENKGKGELTPQQWEELRSPKEKVRYEVKNFFLMNNRLTNGQLSSFCPVLLREEIEGNMEKLLVTPQRINEEFLKVLEVDFSVFYREVMYDDRENGIHNLIIHEEVLPDVILMPNVGGLGRMWQENSGKRRATPGRFTLPILTRADLYKMVLDMIGSFRWEICKRVQGARWNDVSEPSLTSEFCDYLQFYKKNKDLTDNGKEKIAQLMVKSRNNYGKVFVNNYISWITSESLGNMRLDKVSRYILGRYCPFSMKLRARLLEQPMFAEPLGRYERDRKKHLKELNNRRAALRNRGKTETEEFLRELAYYEM